MGLTRYKLGELIELQEPRNDLGLYGVNDVRGVNNLKELIKTKANLSGRDLTKFQVVEPGVFFFNHRTSRNGSKISITYNYEDKTILVTEDYVLFQVKDESILSPVWLYLFFCRAEFDRYAINNSWGSSTEFFNWEDICDVEIDLPSIEIQQKYVDIYNAMVANQKCYKDKINEISLVANLVYEQVRKSSQQRPLRDFITRTDVRNVENLPLALKGLSMENYFIESIANKTGIDFRKYKIVYPGEFACVLMKVGRDCRLTIAQNRSQESYMVSPAYHTFKLQGLDPSYFMGYVSRPEFERRAWFSCDTSARGSLPWEEFLSLIMPIPDSGKQKALANVLDAANSRQEISKRLKAQIKDICPILIKGSLEEASRS